MICPRCKQSGALSDRYDAVYCRTCDLWLEAPCEDGKCWAGCAVRLLSRLEGTEAQREWIRAEIRRKGSVAQTPHQAPIRPRGLSK